MSFCTLDGFCGFRVSLLECMAGTTGLEPATSAVTGQHSNQLNYVPFDCENCFAKRCTLLFFLRFANGSGTRRTCGTVTIPLFGL